MAFRVLTSDPADPAGDVPAVDTAGPGLRDRKRDATRLAVRNAAVRLFLERGFDAVPVDAVAAAADVAPSTVYRHFPTKEDLVLGNIAERQAEFLDDLDAQPRGATLGEALLGAIGSWAPGPGEADPLVRSEVALILATPPLFQRLHAMVAEWEVPIAHRLADRCGRPPADLEVRQLAAAFCATVRLVIRYWAENGAGDLRSVGTAALLPLLHLPAAQLGG